MRMPVAYLVMTSPRTVLGPAPQRQHVGRGVATDLDDRRGKPPWLRRAVDHDRIGDLRERRRRMTWIVYGGSGSANATVSGRGSSRRQDRVAKAAVGSTATDAVGGAVGRVDAVRDADRRACAAGDGEGKKPGGNRRLEESARPSPRFAALAYVVRSPQKSYRRFMTDSSPPVKVSCAITARGSRLDRGARCDSTTGRAHCCVRRVRTRI